MEAQRRGAGRGEIAFERVGARTALRTMRSESPLKLLAPLLAGATRAGGRIALSGILQEQADEVMAIYRQWFDLAQPVFDDGWSCISGTRKA